MAKSTEKKEDLEAQVAKHSSKLESAVARSNTLDGKVAELQADLGALAAQQLKMETLRGEERKILATATVERLSFSSPMLQGLPSSASSK